MKIEWILKFYRDINKEEKHAIFVPFRVTDKKGTSYLVIWRYYKNMVSDWWDDIDVKENLKKVKPKESDYRDQIKYVFTTEDYFEGIEK